MTPGAARGIYLFYLLAGAVLTIAFARVEVIPIIATLFVAFIGAFNHEGRATARCLAFAGTPLLCVIVKNAIWQWVLGGFRKWFILVPIIVVAYYALILGIGRLVEKDNIGPEERTERTETGETDAPKKSAVPTVAFAILTAVFALVIVAEVAGIFLVKKGGI